ncbi:MAG TPA: hypothetical protein VM512_09375 [Burkholderiaceae bacterium]|jgi:hypothetical protein|nr:hypothetical protein [Burkholderiaceae bacterium]
MTALQLLNYASAISALIAAILWFYSTVAKVESDYSEDIEKGIIYLSFHGGRGPIKIQKDGKRIDMVASFDRQSIINACAAVFAGIAALTQAVALGCT